MGRPGIAAIIALAALGGLAAPALAGASQPAEPAPTGTPAKAALAGAPLAAAALPAPGGRAFGASDLRSPALRLATALSPNPAIAGAESIHTLTVTNTGDQAADHVTVSDALDTNTVPGLLPAGCAIVDQIVTCGGPRLTILPGESVTYDIPVVTDPAVPDGTHLRARAEAAAGATTADTAQIIGQARTMADVELQKSAPARAHANGGSTYTITVTNHGPSRATDVTVRDPVAGDGTTITGRPPECPGGGPALACPLGTLEPHESKTFTVTLTPHAAGTIESCATVHTTAREQDTANNRSCASTTVAPGQGATPEPTSVVDMTMSPLMGRAQILATVPDVRRRGGRHDREPGANRRRAAQSERPRPAPGPATRDGAVPAPEHHRSPLPVTGVSYWIFGLGAAVLLSVGLLVRSVSRRDTSAEALAGTGGSALDRAGKRGAPGGAGSPR
ncbi:DUF11 domain-containing protein [Nonomuraea sp. B12E4]|uniref:DUF11 domain-containing protein n=1 Tax=Nonomuraea sp. B12E4 TaxID=3153564 RepID=UPI00325C67C6